MNQRRLVWGTVALFIVPVLADLAVTGARWAFGWLAADAFYYLTVSRNLVHSGRVSFDGTRPTNGFHPLWQLLSALLYGLTSFLPESVILMLTVLANAAMIAAAIWLLAKAFEKVPSLFMILPVGIYALMVSPLWIFGEHFGMRAGDLDENFPPLYGTLWSYANGMESSVVLVMFAGAAVLFAREKPVWFGLLLSGMTLGRLDHGFIAASILACMGLEALWRRRGLREVSIAGLAFAAPIAIYLAANQHWFHMWLPVSGRLKSTFPIVNHHNLDRAADVFLHPWNQGWYRSYRVYQMVIPAAVALAAPLWCRFRRERFDRLLVYASPGVLLLGLYNLCYVEQWEQGHWYFPLSTLYVGLVALRLLQPLDRRWLAPAAAVLCLVFFVKFQHRPGYHQRLADAYFIDAPALRQLYAQPPSLYEYDDGIVTFSTGFPTLVTKGYTLDPEAFDAYRRGDLTRLALARGHDRFVTVSYLGLGNLDTNSSSAEIGGLLRLPGVPAGARYTSSIGAGCSPSST
jgi:hypothetical protein